MSEQAATQLRRLLHVIPRLADGEPHPAADVAKRAGTTADVLLKDLRAISERWGEPGGFVDGLQIYDDGEHVTLVSKDLRRPMGLTRGELWSLELGLAMLAAERPPHEQTVLTSARERVRKAIAKLPNEEIGESGRVASLAAPADPARLATMRAALRESRKVRLAYRRGSAAESSERVVCPYGLLVARGAWYLVAYCERSEDIRVFRMDRVDEARATAEAFERPERFVVSEYVSEGGVFHAEEAPVMRVRYGARIARWIAEREGVETEADGSVTLEHPLADEDWAVRHVLQYGPDAEVLEPASVREAVAERLAGIAG